jgi:cation-transporting ATPase 13A3/4/5
VVARTGFESVKGRLVLSILYPNALPFKFDQQALYFIGALFIVALVGFAVNVKALLDFGASAARIVQRGCDMVTIVVPPALPLALTVGTAYAVLALKKEKILCISPTRVNLAGKVNCFCFDKTGTLTTEGLEFAGVRLCSAAGFFPETTIERSFLSNAMLILLASCHCLTHVKNVLSGDPLELKVFEFSNATLIEPHTAQSNVTSSNAMDTYLCEITLDLPSNIPFMVKAVNAMNPALDSCCQSSDSGKPWVGHILHQFEFVPSLQRMGVLLRVPHNGKVLSLVKGSPEMIQALSDPASIPSDYEKTLLEYTRKGFRVLAAAAKPFDSALLSSVSDLNTLRSEAESNLTFLGFVVLENRLKSVSYSVIDRLKHEASLTVHMITGDNPVAAVCISREAGIVEPGYRVFMGDLVSSKQPGPSLSSSSSSKVQWWDVDDEAKTLDPVTLMPMDGSAAYPYRLALTGRAFAALLEEATSESSTSSRVKLLDRALINCAVFARTSPDHKAQIVQALQKTGMYVGMCGDGANDSLALRAAHIGISLSQVEASVSAPFTSSVPDISCVPKVLCEGRGSLAISFCLFQFMALYSTIQFANALLIVFSNSFLSNNMYLSQDLFIVFILALTLANTGSRNKLTPKRPSGQLLSLYNLAICTGFIVITFFFQIIVYFYVRSLPWFGTPQYPATSQSDSEGTNSAIPETSSVFLMASIQYVAVAIIFSVGYPWKKPTWTNRIFSGWLLVVTVINLLLFLSPNPVVGYNFLSLQVMPYNWNLVLLGLSLASFVGYFIFIAICYNLRARGVFRKLTNCLRRTQPKLHKLIKAEWKKQFKFDTGYNRSSFAQAFDASSASTSSNSTGAPRMNTVAPIRVPAESILNITQGDIAIPNPLRTPWVQNAFESMSPTSGFN